MVDQLYSVINDCYSKKIFVCLHANTIDYYFILYFSVLASISNTVLIPIEYIKKLNLGKA